MDHRGEYAKPDAAKLAGPLWSRGKAVRPYLLLPNYAAEQSRSLRRSRMTRGIWKGSVLEGAV
jgi:hypothetical protein